MKLSIFSHHASAGNLFIGVFAIATVRSFLEFTLKNHFLINMADPLSDLKTYFLHFTSFYFLVYAALSLILYAFASKKITLSECFKNGAFAMMLIWIAPVFGYLTSDTSEILYPTDPMGVICNLHHFFDPHYDYYGMTKGMRIEVFLAGLCATVYLFYKTKHIGKSLLCGLSISLACLLIGLSVPLITQYYEYGFHFGNHELYNSTLLHQGFIINGTGCKIALFYIFVSLILYSLAYYLKSPDKFLTIIKNCRYTRTIHYLFLFISGMLYIYHNPPIMNPAYNMEFEYLTTIWKHPCDILGIIMAILSIFFLFQSAVINNDIYDYDIDVVSNTNRPLITNAISLCEYRLIGRIFIILALAISLCINETFFFFVLLYYLMAFLYSSQPFRLRNYFILSNIELSSIFILTFHAGVTVLIPNYRFDLIPSYVTFGLLFSYSFALAVKDSKDFEGDKKSHVQTLYTLFGKKKGDILTIIFVCFSILITPFLLHMTHLYVHSLVILLLFLLTVLFVCKHRIKEIIIVLLYYSYAVLIFYNLINFNP